MYLIHLSAYYYGTSLHDPTYSLGIGKPARCMARIVWQAVYVHLRMRLISIEITFNLFYIFNIEHELSYCITQCSYYYS